MSNYHLKDKDISLKAKGLLSMILSLPEDWNYTTRGLAAICKEGVDSIGTTLRELESAGYLTRNRLRDKGGRITDTEYVIYEMPHKPDAGASDADEPDTTSPYTENPDMACADTETPDTKTPAQLNTNVSNTQKPKTNAENTQTSNPNQITIQKSNPNPICTRTMDADVMDEREYRRTRLDVEDQIDYEALDTPHNHDRLEEIVEIMTETLCSRRKYIRVGGENYPAEVVKSRFKKLNMYHIEYVFSSLDKKHTEVRNIRQYLMTTLYNAPVTMSNYYDAEVRSCGIL